MFSNILIRENDRMIEIYSHLQKNKVIQPNKFSDGRNSINELQKKGNILKKYKNTNIVPNSKSYILFGSEFEILDKKKFIKFLVDNFDYVIIEKNFPIIENILIENNFKKKKITKTMDILSGRSLLRKIIFDSQNNYFIGPEIYIYYLK